MFVMGSAALILLKADDAVALCILQMLSRRTEYPKKQPSIVRIHTSVANLRQTRSAMRCFDIGLLLLLLAIDALYIQICRCTGTSWIERTNLTQQARWSRTLSSSGGRIHHSEQSRFCLTKDVMRPTASLAFSLATLVLVSGAAHAQRPDLDFLNHNRPLLDAHNCYPYEGRWSDRIQRALNSGYPVSIEQDLAWYVDPATGEGRVVVSHTLETTGTEPTLEDYFFKQVTPVVEKALAENKQDQWPLLVLHFDFKDNQAPLLRAVWAILGRHQEWLSTAVKTSDPHQMSPVDRKPILVVTEESDEQQKVFYDDLPVGARLRLFGSAHEYLMPKNLPVNELMHRAVLIKPEELLSERPTNYRRWWNGSWYTVEEGGEPGAGDWTPADNDRLRSLVNHAHNMGYWVRFYALDGFAPAEDQGWGNTYNFGSREAVTLRWKAAIAAGVNFIATNQYEALAPYLQQDAKELRPAAGKQGRLHGAIPNGRDNVSE